MTNPVWETNYRSGRYNRYPYDQVVSFVLSRFAGVTDRGRIRILDLGCGGGNNTKFLCSEGFDTYAVDGSDTAVALTRNHISGSGDPDKVIKCSLDRLPYCDDFFDCVVDRQSLGHNPASKLDAIIMEVWRILKPRGEYLGFVFSANHPHRRFGRALPEDGDMDNFIGGTFANSGLVHFFTAAEVLDRFSNFDVDDLVINTGRSLQGPAESPRNTEWFLIEATKPELQP